MLTIKKDKITETIRTMVMDANYFLDPSVTRSFHDYQKKERSQLARNVLQAIIDNEALARAEHIPLCQDTGIAVVLVEVGNLLHFDYSLEEAIQEGVRQGYHDGFLRKSIVRHPLRRVNTQDNTPAIIHVKLTMGDELKIHFAPKGGGSENMSRLLMLSPSAGEEGIRQFVAQTIVEAGGRPCPPIIVGLGIGGNFEKAALLAKEAIFRPIDDHASDPDDARLEQELLEMINELHVGPMALGGDTTCLAVKVNSHPCHIASLPVAINIQCHAARKSHATLKGESQ